VWLQALTLMRAPVKPQVATLKMRELLWQQ
jgi:hypothetical protein